MADRTLNDLINNLESFSNDIQAKSPQFILKAGLLFVSEKKEQILASGIGNYSKKKYHPSSLKKKVLTGAGTSFLEAKIKAKEKTNWAELRGAEGLQSSYVDLWYSGKMWQSTRAEKKNQVSYTYWVTVGGTNKDSKNKLSLHYDRYGNFLYPNDEQKKNIVSSLRTSAFNLLKKHLK